MKSGYYLCECLYEDGITIKFKTKPVYWDSVKKNWKFKSGKSDFICGFYKNTHSISFYGCKNIETDNDSYELLFQ